MKAFIAASNQNQEKLREVLDIIISALEESGYETEIYIRRQKEQLT